MNVLEARSKWRMKVSSSSIISFAHFYYLSAWYKFASQTCSSVSTGGEAGFLQRQRDLTGKDGMAPRFAFPLPGLALGLPRGYRVQHSEARSLAENKNTWHLVKINRDLQ